MDGGFILFLCLFWHLGFRDFDILNIFYGEIENEKMAKFEIQLVCKKTRAASSQLKIKPSLDLIYSQSSLVIQGDSFQSKSGTGVLMSLIWN